MNIWIQIALTFFFKALTQKYMDQTDLKRLIENTSIGDSTEKSK
jgi:hypothetical protein